MEVSAIVVLYHPDLNHLRKFVHSLVKQVGLVILVDNTPKSAIDLDIIKSFDVDGKVEHIVLGDNQGIAYAHNVGLDRFKNSGYEYVIIFDQDSFVEENFISDLLVEYKKIEKIEISVAAVGPAFRDTKTHRISPAIQISGLKVNRVPISPDQDYTRSDYIISSGTLIKRETLDIVGGMMDALFIDYVDVEWGLRAKRFGYKCFISNNVIMTHTIGDQSKYVSFVKRYVNIHSDFRKYFLLRNPIYLIFYGNNLPLNWRLIQVPKVFLYFAFVLIYEKSNLKMFRIFFKAVRDALFKKMYKGSM